MGTAVPIQILGVNDRGFESGNAQITEGRTLPWLQPPAGMDVWGAWNVAYRDVVIVDARNHRVEVFNLTEHDLSNPEQYAALRTRLLAAAAAR